MPDRWQELIDGLRTGDGEAGRAFWNQYGPALERIAGDYLAGAVRRRVGPEDVVQSVCRTFLRRAREGEFRLEDAEDLWRLLCAITLTKVREQVRYQQRKKRSTAQEQDIAADDDARGVAEPAAPGPTPAEAAEFADLFEQLLASLDEEERQIVDLKLQEHTHLEIARQLKSSERTVRRILHRVKERLGAMLDCDHERD